MPTYSAPVRDYQFIFSDYLNLEQYKHIKGFEDTSSLDAIMQEGARFAEEVLFPINASGDSEGLKLQDGKVITPKGFSQAYSQYVESGWASFACDEAYGGQGLPNLFNLPIIEFICSSNLSFGLFPGLTHGAWTALHMFGNEKQKDYYLPNMTSGKWTGVMCLTEPAAGTDLGLITTKAEADGNGGYLITGNKIFISCGEHDMSENIVHLILARLPDAPSGMKGISLFVADRNANSGKIVCTGLEHKMGIHASPTCAMSYTKASATLVGEPHKGLRAMFAMMNEARLLVGVQGLGVGEASYQAAINYATDRLQGRSLKGAIFPEKKADPITAHPDVRRMLLLIRSFVEGARMLAAEIYLQVDIRHRSNDEAEKQRADDMIQLLTPIVKAYLTQGGTDSASLAMQVHGGYGFIKDYGVEQYMRDCRITEIYEGTNGVQALDLVGRKLTHKTGKYLRSFFHEVDKFIVDNKEVAEMAEFTKPLYAGFKTLQQASLYVASRGMANPDEAAAASVEYMRIFSLVAVGYAFAKAAKLSLNREDEFYKTKLKTARFFLNRVLPQHYGLLATLTGGVKYLEL
jgi:alkylation response protein AidB-like acyl-CoA dehydrogenase